MNSVKRINVLFLENKAGPDYDIDVDGCQKYRHWISVQWKKSATLQVSSRYLHRRAKPGGDAGPMIIIQHRLRQEFKDFNAQTNPVLYSPIAQ